MASPNSAVGRAPVPAGTSLLGTVGVDQTTDGTTNKVQAHLNVAAAAVTAANPIQVQSVGFSASSSQARPNDTTPYTAGDVVGAAATNRSFASLGSINAGHIVITGAWLKYKAAAIISGMTTWRLHLYNAAPTNIADNAAYSLADADEDKYIGYIEFSALEDLVANLWRRVDNLNLKTKHSAASTTIYGLLETVGGFTPAANTVVEVGIEGFQL
jgi:hypothetical protein